MEEQGEPIHIVAVDDDEMILKAITSILEAAGHRVTAFSNAREAMDQLPDLAPDCVISDLMMPDIDGFQLCKYVRAHELLKDTVFIVLTAKSYEFDVNRSYEFGANGFIRKPIVPATFLEKVDRILRDDMQHLILARRRAVGAHFGGVKVMGVLLRAAQQVARRVL